MIPLKYQIFVDRGNGRLELEGCWGSEHAQFRDRAEAESAADRLADLWPACTWVVCNLNGTVEVYRTKREAIAA
jgi:hypothetical protein